MSTSSSEASFSIGQQIEALGMVVDETIDADVVGTVTPEHLKLLVSTAVRLYAAACEREGCELPPVTATISTTEAVRLSVALARSQGLSAFDLALWFAQMRPTRP